MMKVNNRARWAFVTLALLMMLLAAVPGVFAQALVDNALVAGVPESGELSTAAPARVFQFATTGSEASVELTATSPEGAGLLLLVNDADGRIYGQASAPDGAVTLSLELGEAGNYLVTIAASAFPEAAESVSFELTLTVAEDVVVATPAPEVTVDAAPPAEATAEVTQPPAAAEGYTPPQNILLTGGIQVRLSWAAPVDMNLEVRDPFGNSLFWDSRQSPIGGSFGFDANGFCEVVSTDPVQEEATWAPGFLPTGSYEILVFYRQACEGSAPVAFRLDVTVDGQALPTIEGALSPPTPGANSVYLSNFIVAEDGSANINTGGVYPDASLNILPATAAEIQAAAIPLQSEAPVTGEIFEAQDWLSYSFQGTAGEFVALSLTAIEGSLDTLLQVIGPDGTLVGVSDDIAFDNKNSALPNLRLPSTGIYNVIATRYGKELGGTEGVFELLLSSATAQVPAVVQELNLPPADLRVVLNWNTNADLQLLVRDPVGDAVFDDQPRINSGGILAAQGNVNCTVAQGTPVSAVYWPAGFLRPGTYEVEVWYQNNCNDTRAVEMELTVLVGDEVVLIERERPLPDQRYVISFTVNADRSASAGPGGFISVDNVDFDYRTEIPSAISLNQPVSGQINSQNTFDVYSFQGTAGQVVSIGMANSSGNLDTKLFLIGPGGVQVASNDDANPAISGGTGRTTDALIGSVTLPGDGEYLVIATRFATIYGGTTGTYLLTVSPG